MYLILEGTGLSGSEALFHCKAKEAVLKRESIRLPFCKLLIAYFGQKTYCNLQRHFSCVQYTLLPALHFMLNEAHE